MPQFMIYSFNQDHRPFDIWLSFVYSSMMPCMVIRKTVGAALHDLLKRRRRGGGSRLQV